MCASLTAHPDSPCASVRSLVAEVHVLRAGLITVRFTLTGDLRGLRIPPDGPGERADALWQHTCFEAFVRREAEQGYLEFNFSPSSAWQAYRFSGHRQGMRAAELPQPPRVTVGYRERNARTDDPPASPDEALVLEALVHLPARYADAPQGLGVALSAVVEDEAGTLSYWALRHAPGRPDFHHPDAFALLLESS